MFWNFEMLDVKPHTSEDHVGRPAPITNFPMLLTSGIELVLTITRFKLFLKCNYSNSSSIFVCVRQNRLTNRPGRRQPLHKRPVSWLFSLQVAQLCNSTASDLRTWAFIGTKYITCSSIRPTVRALFAFFFYSPAESAKSSGNTYDLKWRRYLTGENGRPADWGERGRGFGCRLLFVFWDAWGFPLELASDRALHISLYTLRSDTSRRVMAPGGLEEEELVI